MDGDFWWFEVRKKWGNVEKLMILKYGEIFWTNGKK
jgi:hypothetical protein